MIYIKAGVYEEKVLVTKPHVSLIGVREKAVTLTYSDNAKKLKEEMRTFSVLVAKNITFKNHTGLGNKVGQVVAVYPEGDQLELIKFVQLVYVSITAAPLKGDVVFGGPRDKAKKRVGRHYFYSLMSYLIN